MSLLLKFRRWLKRGCTVALYVAVGVLIATGIRYGCVDFAKYVVSRVHNIDSTCVPAVGITRSQLLERFPDVKLYVLAEYDKSLKCDVARWMYQVGDSDIYYTFKYSYGTGTVVSWKLQREYGYYNWDFTDYLRPADIKTERKQ